eukprot:scaffold2663_cov256-Pinguiococcus_pyrenoidosus.AAC.14
MGAQDEDGTVLARSRGATGEPEELRALLVAGVQEVCIRQHHLFMRYSVVQLVHGRCDILLRLQEAHDLLVAELVGFLVLDLELRSHGGNPPLVRLRPAGRRVRLRACRGLHRSPLHHRFVEWNGHERGGALIGLVARLDLLADGRRRCLVHVHDAAHRWCEDGLGEHDRRARDLFGVADGALHGPERGGGHSLDLLRLARDLELEVVVGLEVDYVHELGPLLGEELEIPLDALNGVGRLKDACAEAIAHDVRPVHIRRWGHDAGGFWCIHVDGGAGLLGLRPISSPEEEQVLPLAGPLLLLGLLWGLRGLRWRRWHQDGVEGILDVAAHVLEEEPQAPKDLGQRGVGVEFGLLLHDRRRHLGRVDGDLGPQRGRLAAQDGAEWPNGRLVTKQEGIGRQQRQQKIQQRDEPKLVRVPVSHGSRRCPPRASFSR